MSNVRHFLGWDEPALPRAAGWLLQRFGADMHHVIVGVPAARAQRRLLELLAEQTVGQAMRPPKIVTAGQLPEMLCDLPTGIADELSAMAARAHALRNADVALLEPVTPHPPQRDDVSGWWALAEQIHALSRELSAERLNISDVTRIAEQHGLDLGLSEPRWEALAGLDERYRETLNGPDAQSARLDAIRDKRCGCDGPVVLVGMPDLTRQLTGMLEQLNDVTALIQSPEQHAAGFDALGGLVVDYWQEQQVAVQDLRMVDRPRDEAATVAARLAELPSGTAAQQVTVGLGDEKRAEAIGRAIELAGGRPRFAGGRAVSRSRPAVLLRAVSAYMERRRFAELAALIRHPDVGQAVGLEPESIKWLDDYLTRFLAMEVGEAWRGNEKTQTRMEVLGQAVESLLPEDWQRSRSLPQWAEPILEVLDRVYGQRVLERHRDHALIGALEELTKAARSLTALDEENEATPRVTLAQAVGLLLRQLSGKATPEPGDVAAVEMVGFLELPLDDAEHVVLTGLNEGVLPATRNADAFLPDGLRRVLGLTDNARRYARDLFLLNAVVHSRSSATLIAPRRSAEGDPLMPSRLLLACDEEELVRRVSAFYAEDADPTPTVRLLQPGGNNRFLIPRPALDEPVLNELSVTAFKDYIECPYRFYLKRILKLGAMDDRAVELDALAFGNLAHSVLEEFGKSQAVALTEPDAVNEYLNDQLQTQVTKQYGKHPRVAVLIQVVTLRERFAAFAATQARIASEGWRPRADLIEQELRVEFQLDGKPFTVKGKIDRVDEHPTQGFRVLDYKTFENGKSPEKTHLQRDRWVDLQLPLYRHLSEPYGIAQPQLGYLNLSKPGKGNGLQLARWDASQLAAADEQRDWVIRHLRQQKFWPPTLDPPKFDDGLARVCGDAVPDRAEHIGRSTR